MMTDRTAAERQRRRLALLAATGRERVTITAPRADIDLLRDAAAAANTTFNAVASAALAVGAQRLDEVLAEAKR